MKIEKHETGNENAPAASKTYRVGYGKPPKKTRFKKGTSGNPAGRPRGSKNKERSFGAEKFKELLLKEAYRDIEVRDGNETITVPMAEAVIRATAVKAAKGFVGSARLFTEMLNEVEAGEQALKEEFFQTMVLYKIDAKKEIARRKKLGIVDDGKSILPHPDDVIVNPRTGDVRIAGPMSVEEWDQYAFAAKHKISLKENIAFLEKCLAENPDDEDNDDLESSLREDKSWLAKIDKFLPDSWIEREKKHWTYE